jgi:hypothetical protein
VSALLKRFWTDHRLASVLSLALLFLGLLIKPWTLVLVLAVAFGGPILQRLESFSTSPFAGWRRSNWIALALLVGAVLLALTGKSGGQGALILALLPVAWVLVTDRGILQGRGEDERASLQEPLTPSRPTDEEESSALAESQTQNEIATAETPERLIGGELLAKIKELGDIGKSDLVRACGYISNRPDGSERLNFTDFYEALLEAKGIETSGSSSDSEDEEEPTVDFDVLWAYFQEGGGDIWNEEETVYLGTFEGDPGTYIIEVNGPDEYGVPYCTGREDLPRIVEAFIENGGSTSDLLKAVGASSSNSSKIILPEDWEQLENSEVVERLKTSVDISAEILRALSGSDDWEVRQAVAWHENTPTDVLEVLAEDGDSDVRRATQERSLPSEWRTKSEDEKVSALQAADVPLEVIQALATSERWTLRQAVAWSPSTPESILEKLREDDDDDVKVAATTERQLPVDWRFLSSWEKVERLGEEPTDLVLLDILAKSRASDVRRAVALHPGTPEHLISTLREDDDDSVQSGVRERDLPDSWKSMDDEERISALKSDDVPESVLLILARSNSWTIRQAVALSPGTSEEILNRLSGDNDTDVQSAVRERGLPEDWKQLDEDGKVERLNEGSAEKHVLEILARSGRWTIRQAVAQNAGATEQLLNSLLKDDDDDVKRAAKKSLKKLSGEDSAKKGSGPMTYYFGIYQGDSNAGSCYLAELQTTEQDDHEVEGGNISDELREALEDGGIGWGPFQDQNLIVWTEEDGEEDVIAVIDIEDAISNDKVHDCQVHLGYDTQGKHIVGVLTEKGGYNGELDLDIELFDIDKVTFGVVNLADRWQIVTSVQYDGEEVGMEGDTTGKSSEYFVFEDDEITNLA